MAEAKQSQEWNHTAALLCGIASIFSDKQLSPADFHPMLRRDKPEPESNWSETIASIRSSLHGKRG